MVKSSAGFERTRFAGDRADNDCQMHPALVTSRDNRWLKMFRKALQGTGPRGLEPIGVEGAKLVREAVLCGRQIDALLVSDSSERELEGILRATLDSEFKIAKTRILKTSDKLFGSASGTETSQGVAGLFRQPQWALEDVLGETAGTREHVPLVVVVAGVQDPGNVGTILRSAEAFGATGAVATRGTADPWSAKALRASAGSSLRLPVLRGIGIPALLAQLKNKRVKIIAASSRRSVAEEAPEKWRDLLREGAAIFIGNEGSGLPTEVEDAADATVSIPMRETVESLNAGVAASLVLYEATKREKQ